MTFGVPLSYFFDDMPLLEEADMAGFDGGVQQPSAPGPMDRRETPELARTHTIEPMKVDTSKRPPCFDKPGMRVCPGPAEGLHPELVEEQDPSLFVRPPV